MKNTDNNREITISTDELCAVISTFGGELQSLKNSGGLEYLWQGDATYWKDRSPNLFPYVGRMVGGQYTFCGKTYKMDIHGFVKYMPMEVEEHTPSTLILKLEDNESTRLIYPFEFIYRIKYVVTGSRLDIEYSVENKGDGTMYFGIGAHPGFNVPLTPELCFEDYRLEFSEGLSPILLGLDEKCFRNGEDSPLILEEDKYLPLSHGMFDYDSLILSHCGTQVTLASSKGSAGVRVSFPEMPYLGIWQTSFTDAPYVCLEPWVSLPAWQNKKPDLQTQADLLSLEAGKSYHNAWSIDIF